VQQIQNLIPAESYVFKVGLPDDILRFLGEDLDIDDTGEDLNNLLHDLEAEDPFELEQYADTEEEGLNENQATIIRLVNQLILEGTQVAASDIHIEPRPTGQAAQVRYRVDGICRNSVTIPATHIRAVVARIKVMSSLDISERRQPQDGKCSIRYRQRRVELRVATLPTVHGEAAVLRILASNKPLPLDKMNFSGLNRKAVTSLASATSGLLLVVGPTGSGKTTTLHSILNYMNTPERKIWTAEDPVEITQPGLQQTQIQPKIGYDFAKALRALLRADPDVIMIGEMRDLETAQAAAEAALTGHLVLSTLHTNSAPETITRLMDLGLDRVSFADALNGILAQRLVRKLCPACSTKRPPDPSELRLIESHYGKDSYEYLLDQVGEFDVPQSVGCNECAGSGYQGRTGIHELLCNSAEIRDMIFHNKSVIEIRAQAMRGGMRTLMQDGIDKVLRGQTDFQELRKILGG